MKVIPASELENHIGEEVGVSDWFEVTQERINQFAEATNDHQFIHVDPEMAKATPWGTTCLLYTSPSPRDLSTSRMPSSA